MIFSPSPTKPLRLGVAPSLCIKHPVRLLPSSNRLFASYPCPPSRPSAHRCEINRPFYGPASELAPATAGHIKSGQASFGACSSHTYGWTRTDSTGPCPSRHRKWLVSSVPLLSSHRFLFSRSFSHLLHARTFPSPQSAVGRIRSGRSPPLLLASSS